MNKTSSLEIADKDPHVAASGSVEEPHSQYDGDDDYQYIFPQRLMSILLDERNHDAICWLPHGRGFIIRNRKLFAEKIMPRFFPRRSKYSSFTRKLNRWNFTRISSGPELGSYYHEFFLRDKPHLAAQMFCKSVRTKLAMASSSPKTVPHMVHNGSVSPPVVPAVQPGPMTAPAMLTPHPMPVHLQVPHHQQMKPAPVMAKVAGRGGVYNPPHMDQAMHYLLQHQLNLGENPAGSNNGRQPQHHHQQAPQPMVMAAPDHQQHQHEQSVHQHNGHQQQEFCQPNNGTLAVSGDNSYGEPLPLHHNNNGDMNLSFWPEIPTHKQEDAHAMHLRQLMKFNLNHRQQSMQPHVTKNNCRASAA